MPAVKLALDLLHVVNGSNNLGLGSMSVKDFSSREFELMSYLSVQIAKMKSKQKTKG